MPVQIFQQTTNIYSDAEIAANAQLRSVQYAISAPYSALMQVAKKALNGEPVFDGNDIVAQPGQGGFTNIFGIRFKSFDSAHPTTILCKAFFQDDPTPTGDLSSSTVFTTSGSTSGGQVTALTGQVNADGSIAAGSGFTITHLATGRFQINFTSPFTTPPVVLPSPVATLAGGIFCFVESPPTINAAIVHIKTAAGADTDLAFNFAVFTMV